MPLFTQTAEYDVVLVADERGDFGEYLPYQTWVSTPSGRHPRADPHRLAQDRGNLRARRSCKNASKPWPDAG